ncbi:MAG: hypothetical protein WBH44_04745 [Proteocatella sp.]
MKKIISMIAVLVLLITGILIYGNTKSENGGPESLKLQESDALQLVSEKFDTSKYAFEVDSKKKIGETEYIIVEVKLNGESIKPYVAVDNITGELKTYYESDSIEDFAKFPVEKEVVKRQDWNGKFEENGKSEDNMKKLELMQADDNSFEFTFDFEKNKITKTFTGVAIISGNEGIYKGENGLEINFEKDDTQVRISEIGSNPFKEDGIFFAGEYEIND